MNILVTGGTGFIGKVLVTRLLARGDDVTVLSRQSSRRVATLLSESVKCVHSLDEIPSSCTFGAVFNLAGEGVMERRWSSQRKEILRQSRIALTEDLIRWFGTLEQRPEVLVSASAVGYYGGLESSVRADECFPAGSDFAAQLCKEWELAARGAELLDIRVCLVRIGVVLHPSGGALKKILPAFRLGLGGPMGDGRQMMPWVHREDMVNSLLFLQENKTTNGVYNAVSPQPVSNTEFSHALARVLGRPAVLRLPARFVELLLGESSLLVVEGQGVVPKRLQSAGFKFAYDRVESAFADLLG